MMLMGIRSLKNSYFYNEFKNDWNYWNGIVILNGQYFKYNVSNVDCKFSGLLMNVNKKYLAGNEYKYALLCTHRGD